MIEKETSVEFKEPAKKWHIRFFSFLNDVKLLAGALILLPFFGSQINSMISWGRHYLQHQCAAFYVRDRRRHRRRRVGRLAFY